MKNFWKILKLFISVVNKSKNHFRPIFSPFQVIANNFDYVDQKNPTPTIFWDLPKNSKLFTICRKWFLGILCPPPRKIGYLKKNLSKMEKNQSWPKLYEMARKLVENKFWIFFCPPPPKKNQDHKFLLVTWKNLFSTNFLAI